MTCCLLTRTAAVALVSFALGAVPALAQIPPGQPATQPPMGQVQPGMPAQGQTSMKDRRLMRVEQHITELHRQLHITAAEEPQWSAFAQVMRENAAHMEQAFQSRAQQGANMNALDDLRSYAAVAQAHAEDMQRLLPAFEALYGSLSPQQRKTADEVFRDFEQRRDRRNG